MTKSYFLNEKNLMTTPKISNTPVKLEKENPGYNAIVKYALYYSNIIMNEPQSQGQVNTTKSNDASNSSGTDGGLNVISAAIFVAAEMAGSGVLAIPKAVVNCGWPGLFLFIFFCLNAGYGGTRLGLCWDIVEERYPQHRGRTRNPYPTIAYRAVGRWGSLLITGSMQFTLFGVCTVNLLLSAQVVQGLLVELVPGVGYCLWFLIFAAVITPPMWLGSPKDFWVVGVGALLTTAAACALIFVQTVIEGLQRSTPVPHVTHSLDDFFLSFGTILFAYGGAATFPTIQNDMVRRDKFPTSVSIGFIVVLMLYMPVVFGGYFFYGDDTKENILLSLPAGPMTTSANILIAVHLILAFLILANPISQGLEEILNVPQGFGVKRCLLRTCMVLLMIVVGTTIPDFGKILSLVGGSTITLMTFVLPPYFYMRLCDQKNTGGWIDRKIPVHIRAYLWLLMAVGIVGGVCSTYSALVDIFGAGSFTKPCYWPKN